MQAIRSILVVIEPDQLEGLALKRAQLIAGVTQSHLHLLVCEKRRDHSAALNDLAQELREEGYSVSTNQAWKDSLHQTIIAEQQAEGCGLIIKQHFPDNPLKKAILTPDDWKLLRFAPCPVLMTKTARPWTSGESSPRSTSATTTASTAPCTPGSSAMPTTSPAWPRPRCT